MSRSRKTADASSFRMQGRNLALPILGASIAIGVVIGLMVQAAHPEDQSGYYFGIPLTLTIAAGIVVMLVWQGGWYRRSRDHYVESRVAAAVDAPTRPAGPNLEPLELRRAMATEPQAIDAEQVRAEARAQMAPGDYSMKSGRTMTLLVLVTMIPAIVLQDVQLMLLGAIPVVGYCLYLCARLLKPGGGLDQAYAGADREFAPLGLRLTGRPELHFGAKLDSGASNHMRMTHEMVGPMVFEGTRHGRGVHVEIEDGASIVHVAAPSPLFQARSRYGRLQAEDGGERIEQALARMPASNHWTGAKIRGGAEGITIARRTKSGESWVYDLWLAEALAGTIS